MTASARDVKGDNKGDNKGDVKGDERNRAASASEPRLSAGALGDFIREQRRVARLSLRKLSDMADISNPYLSQIERGLRKPSAEILQQLAKALRISAETLYVQAGILDERVEGETDLATAINDEKTLSDTQKRALIQILRSFQAENRSTPPADTPR